MTHTRLFILLIFLVVLPTTPSLGAVPMPTEGNISINSDSMSQDTANEVFTATGHVTIRWQGMTLTADKATYDRKTRVLHATDNVLVVKGDETLRGNSIKLDMDTGRGELEKGVLNSTTSNVTFVGEKITRINDNEVELTTTELTTCDLPDPSWKFGADHLKVNLLGYAVGRGVTFYIKDVPVLYLPWMAFPVVRERKSGLLFPRMGYSSNRGAQLDIPLYLVLSPSQDLVLDLDFETKRGVGTGVDYRYIWNRGSEGRFGGYLIYDLLKDRWRGQMNLNHKEIFSPTMNVRADINLDSDRSFQGDFGEKSGDYNRQSNDTVVNALKTWQNYALSGYLRFAEDLYAVDNSHTLQTLPEVSLAGVRQQIPSTPVYFDLDSSVANLYREVDPTGQRLTAFPRLTYVTGLPGYLNASAYAGLHVRGYATQDSPGGTTKENDGDLLPEFGARAATSLSRVYDIGGTSLKKLRHEITPELSYTYAPNHDQSRLPFYDYNDRLVGQNIISASVTSFLGGKFQTGDTTTYRDISLIRLTQGYSAGGTRRDLLTMVDANRPWTDLTLESETWLHPQAKFTIDARYNLYDKRFSSAAPGVELDDKQGNSAALSYRMARNQVEYLEGKLATKYFTPWTLGYTTRYSFDRPGFLESVYSVEYRQKCWSVNVSIGDRPGSHFSFHFGFNLEGLMTSK
ncbi:LPS-assembly protein LptD [Oryzomonas sagensis]|uniref:LPS-assembly protein LptD n=1 Tax=Oryzomonas sagensis TaxID=2603857 RepID=A0ABQ6TPG4_9BACT|nr:LPS assembly protein LptD [Oryzomonas sagensis]KAB0670531.1 LPS-assembly protein LptD [Oryzomonas sagensis]